MFKKNVVKGFQQKSKNVINVFQATIKGLKSVNASIRAQLSINDTKVKDINSESDQLDKILESNSNMEAKLSNFLNN